MLYLKSCPRCAGDIQIDDDPYGAFARCLQCGFNRDFPRRRPTEPSSEAPPTPVEQVEEEAA